MYNNDDFFKLTGYFNTKNGEKKEAYGNFILSIYKDTSLHNKFSETYNDETTIHYDNDNYYMASDSYELNKDTIDEVALFNQFSLKTDEDISSYRCTE